MTGHRSDTTKASQGSAGADGSGGRHDRFDRRFRVSGEAHDALRAVLVDNSDKLF